MISTIVQVLLMNTLLLSHSPQPGAWEPTARELARWGPAARWVPAKDANFPMVFRTAPSSPSLLAQSPSSSPVSNAPASNQTSGHVPAPVATPVATPVPPPVLLRDPSAPEDLAPQLLTIKRIFVNRLTGGETAAQMRDLVISSLQNSKLFILTENPDRADAMLRGAAEDLIFTDAFSSSEGINAHGSAGNSAGSGSSERFNGAGSGYDTRSSRSMSMGVGEEESTNIKERKHEALATVRLVNKDGDVIWSTTQESTGAKFRGASADVAEKITHRLFTDVEKLRRPVPRN